QRVEDHQPGVTLRADVTEDSAHSIVCPFPCLAEGRRPPNRAARIQSRTEQCWLTPGGRETGQMYAHRASLCAADHSAVLPCPSRPCQPGGHPPNISRSLHLVDSPPPPAGPGATQRRNANRLPSVPERSITPTVRGAPHLDYNGAKVALQGTKVRPGLSDARQIRATFGKEQPV